MVFNIVLKSSVLVSIFLQNIFHFFFVFYYRLRRFAIKNTHKFMAFVYIALKYRLFRNSSKTIQALAGKT